MAVTLDAYIEARKVQGVPVETIRQELITDLQEGGRLFGEFRSAIRATANGTIHRFRDVGELTEFDTTKEDKFMWVAVLIKTCPDCVERNGIIKTWEEWVAEGLPRTGHTVCQQYCRCVLVPEETTVIRPIKREGRP
jgi:hypothetical protein